MALKMIISMALITCMALVLVITTNISNNNNESLEVDHDGLTTLEYSYLHAKQPAKKVSRFLVEKEKPNPRAADHCHKDDDICYDLLEGSKNSTCCNNKCVDIAIDKNHCGACKSKCKKYTDDCCGGKCVNLAYDKGNCGSCGFKCRHGKYCIYGFCDYA